MRLIVDNYYEDRSGALWHYLLEKPEDSDFASLKLCSIDHIVLCRFRINGEYYWHPKTGMNLVREYKVFYDTSAWVALNPNLHEDFVGYGQTVADAICDLKVRWYDRITCANTEGVEQLEAGG